MNHRLTPAQFAEALRLLADRVNDGSVSLASFVATTRHGSAYVRGHLVESPRVHSLMGMLDQAAGDIRVALATFEQGNPIDIVASLGPAPEDLPTTEADALRSLLCLLYDPTQKGELDDLRPNLSDGSQVPCIDEMVEGVIGKRVDAIEAMNAIASWASRKTTP